MPFAGAYQNVDIHIYCVRLHCSFHSERHSRASGRETSKDTDSHALFIYPNANEERTEAIIKRVELLKRTVDRLPCKIESTYGLVWGGIVCAFVSWILPVMAERNLISVPAALNTSIVFMAIGASCWFSFYYFFAIGCRSLNDKSYHFIMMFLYMNIIGLIASIVSMACEVPWISGIGGIAAIIGFIYWIKTGNFLKKNYSGKLGETGTAMIRIIIYSIIAAVIAAVIAVFYVVFFADAQVSETAVIISTVIILAIGFWLFAVTYVTIFAPIIEMLESGHVHEDIG